MQEKSRKPLIWLKGEIKTPPFTQEARQEAGELLASLQCGDSLSLPQSRPMPSIGKRCHELKIKDESKEWRIVYRTDEDAIIIAEVFPKKTKRTPKKVIDICKKRLAFYDSL